MKSTKPKRVAFHRVWCLIQKMNQLQKKKLLAKLEQDKAGEEWDRLIEKLTNFRQTPISDEQITQIVEQVRQERYENSKSRS